MLRLARLGHSVKWGVVSTATTTLLQLALMAVMARLLLPADYGLVATAGVALRFLSNFAQMGVMQAMVQKPELGDGDIGAALRVSVTISMVFTIAALVASPLAQWFFDMPGLGWVVAALSLNFALGGVGNIATGILRRKLDFRTIALIEIGSYVIGYGLVGLPSAWAGAHAWALVAATLTQAALSAATGGFLTLRGVRLGHEPVQRRHFLSFGGRFALVGFLEFLSSSFDAVVVGKFFGPSSAGLYNRAQLLANLPADRPAGILTRALFPYLSALHSEREKQSIGVQLTLMLIGGYAFAASAGVAVAAPDIITVLLGSRWQSAAGLLRILALAVGPMFVTHVIGTTFDSLGLLRQKMAVQIGMLMTLALTMKLLYPQGLGGLALAVVIAESLRAALYLFLLHREFRFSARIWWTCACIALTNAVAVGAGTSLAFVLTPGEAPILLRLVIDMLGSAAGLLLVAIVSRPLFRELDAMQVARARIPWLDRYLGASLCKPTIGANQ